MSDDIEFTEVLGLVGCVAGIVVGGIAGYKIGGEAINYAKNIANNTDLLAYIVKQHPIIIKYITTTGVAGIIGSLGTIGGGLAGLVIDVAAGRR
jgi:hypothetical protein